MNKRTRVTAALVTAGAVGLGAMAVAGCDDHTHDRLRIGGAVQNSVGVDEPVSGLATLL